MDLVSSCGLPVASIVWQSATGAWALTAVCKATFRIVPGTMVLAHTQEPPNEEDNYWNDDESRSLQTASDLVPFKPRADVLVVGHAFAPRGTTVRSLSVRVTTGSVDKTLEAWCDRWFELDGRVREGAPFARMPLRYERAAGGIDTTNPAGMPFDALPDAYGRVPIANLQPSGSYLSFRGDSFPPIGLGPLAPHWPERATKLYHAFPREWHRRWHSRPLPEAIDPAYFNAAPRDQQSEHIHPNERIALENLHAEHVRLVTRLPGLQPEALVKRATGHLGRMDLVADTLWIDTDRALCTVVWRGRIGLTHAGELGTITFTCDGISEQMIETEPPSATLSSLESGLHVDPQAADATMTLAPGLAAAPGPVIPFEATSPWARSRMAEASEPRPPVRSEDAGETLFLFPTSDAGAPLPFAHVAVPAEPSPPLAPSPKPQSLELRPETSQPFVSPSLRPEIGSSDTQAVPTFSEPPTPPPMLGPVAASAMAAALRRLKTDLAGQAFATPPPMTVPIPPPGQKIEDYPLARCARIAARLACKPEETATVLAAEDLESTGWEKLHEHWLTALRAKAERRDKTLVLEYDRAYVTELEAQRGPITPEDYAVLAEAAERGVQAQALAERKLPEQGWPNIHRAWIERTIRDPPLAARIRLALATQRNGMGG